MGNCECMTRKPPGDVDGANTNTNNDPTASFNVSNRDVDLNAPADVSTNGGHQMSPKDIRLQMQGQSIRLVIHLSHLECHTWCQFMVKLIFFITSIVYIWPVTF